MRNFEKILLFSFFSFLSLAILFTADVSAQGLPTEPTEIVDSICLAFDSRFDSICGNYENQADCNDRHFCFWRDNTVQNELASFNNEQFYPPRIIEVIEDKVYQAIGFGLANIYFVKTAPQSYFVVDSGESSGPAREALDAFLAFVNLDEATFRANLRALFYTHSHGDHISGSEEILGNRTGIPIWAHAKFLEGVESRVNPVRANLGLRTLYMIGFFLPKNDPNGHVSSGLGPYFQFEPPLSFAEPTNTFDDYVSFDIDNVTIELYHTPGETPEELFLYIDEYSIGFVGDNFYQMFPQLYTIRGTPPRSATDWAESLAFVRDNFPNMEVMAPGHTTCIYGHAEIVQALSDWNIAITDLETYATDRINQQINIHDIVDSYTLPAIVEHSPYLKEFYGLIDDHVRAVHSQFYGWFSGDISELKNESTDKKAAFIIDLCTPICILRANHYMREGDYNSALKIADALRKHYNDDCGSWYYNEANEIYVQAAKLLAYQSPASNNRNYYLTIAQLAENDPCEIVIA